MRQTKVFSSINSSTLVSDIPQSQKIKSNYSNSNPESILCFLQCGILFQDSIKASQFHGVISNNSLLLFVWLVGFFN